jgi:hypothetical protein
MLKKELKMLLIKPNKLLTTQKKEQKKPLKTPKKEPKTLLKTPKKK